VTIVTIYVDSPAGIEAAPIGPADDNLRIDLGHNTFLTLTPDARVRLGEILNDTETT
jgi:hypothetical protein